MNCLEFESQTETLARGALTDARTRAAAEAHGESCGTCAARLADARSLSVGLRALAEGMKTAEAPARVEAALIAAFRAGAAPAAAAGSSEVAAGREVAPMSGHAPARRLSWAKTIAVASMAAAASLALFVLVRPDAGVNAPGASRATAASAKRKMVQPPPDSNGGPAAPALAQHNQSNAVEGSEPRPAPEETIDKSSRPGFVPRSRLVNASLPNRGGLARPAQGTDARAPEVATEFIPLMQAGPYSQAEEGHLVRVELPRSALASFGLPVDVEAPPGGRVKADVLMGQDGIARAIRFVR